MDNVPMHNAQMCNAQVHAHCTDAQLCVSTPAIQRTEITII